MQSATMPACTGLSQLPTRCPPPALGGYGTSTAPYLVQALDVVRVASAEHRDRQYAHVQGVVVAQEHAGVVGV